MDEPSSSSSRSSLARRARQPGGFDSDESDSFRRSAWLLLLDLSYLEPRLEEARKRRVKAASSVSVSEKIGEHAGLHAEYIKLDAQGWQISNGSNGLAHDEEEGEEEEDDGWQMASSKKSRRRRAREHGTGRDRREASVGQSVDTSRTAISSDEHGGTDNFDDEEGIKKSRKKSSKKKRRAEQRPSEETQRLNQESVARADKEAPHKDEEQVGLDIRRSFVGFKEGPLADVKLREERRRQLQDVIRAVLRRRRGLHYYQGYHDVISIFLLVLVPPRTPPERDIELEEQERDLELWTSPEELECMVDVCERVSLHYLRDSMTTNLDPTLGQLKLMRNLLREAEPRLARRIEVASPLPHFAISWLISFFSHDVPLEQSRRIFDFVLASANGPASILYIATALVIWNKDLIMGDARDDESADPAELHHLLSKLPMTLDHGRAASLFQDETEGLSLPCTAPSDQDGQLACVLELADDLANRYPLDKAPLPAAKKRVDAVMGPRSVLNTWSQLPHVQSKHQPTTHRGGTEASNQWQQADAFAETILEKSSSDVSIVVVDAMPSPPPSPTLEIPPGKEKASSKGGQRRKAGRRESKRSTAALIWVGAGAVGVVSAAALIMYGSEAITSGDLRWAGQPLVEAIWKNVRL